MSDSVNLEYLRKQAKTILKDCRAGDASAIRRVLAQLPRLVSAQIKLADVHHVLARENGCANWGELKRRDAPLARFLAAVRSGALKAAQRELEKAPELVEESIHAACVIGDEDAVDYHLALDPGLLNTAEDGWPPLLYACATPFHQLSARYAAGILQCARLLLDRGADPNTPTAVFRASSALNRPVLLLLIQRGARHTGTGATPKMTKQALWGIPPNAAPMDDALRDLFKDPAIVEEMRRRMAPVTSRHTPWFKKPQPGFGPEHLSPRDFYETPFPGNQEYSQMIWELLIERGVQPDWTDTSSDTPLHHLAKWGGDAAAAELFLAHGAGPNLPGLDGKTPYFLAVRAGNKAVAHVLRTYGAGREAVRPVDELAGACRHADADAAWAIVRPHPDILKTLGPEDYEILVTAAGRNHLDSVKLMAELGFDLGRFGESGATALHLAAWYGHVQMAQLLISLGAPVNVRDAAYGTSPIAWAAHGSGNYRDADEEYCAIIERLWDAGADYASSVSRWGVGPERAGSDRVVTLLRSLALR